MTNADVAYLLHDGKNKIREIEPVINKKATAREQLTTLFNDKKQAIEANVQATVEERNSIWHSYKTFMTLLLDKLIKIVAMHKLIKQQH